MKALLIESDGAVLMVEFGATWAARVFRNGEWVDEDYMPFPLYPDDARQAAAIRHMLACKFRGYADSS